MNEDRNGRALCQVEKVCTYRVIEWGRKVAAQVVDGGVDGGFSLVFLQILVCSLH